ncbi:MAG: hypothetical protein JXA17_08460, partial [Dehalococcoidales bacterium]|nr:hypothetical protein [Dehalococcoidales bacterium]
MKRNLVFLCGALLILAALLIPTGGIGVAQDQDIRSGVDKTPLPPDLSVYLSDYTIPFTTDNTIILKNPTFLEMKDFILKDTTSR